MKQDKTKCPKGYRIIKVAGFYRHQRKVTICGFTFWFRFHACCCDSLRSDNVVNGYKSRLLKDCIDACYENIDMRKRQIKNRIQYEKEQKEYNRDNGLILVGGE